MSMKLLKLSCRVDCATIDDSVPGAFRVRNLKALFPHSHVGSLNVSVNYAASNASPDLPDQLFRDLVTALNQANGRTVTAELMVADVVETDGQISGRLCSLTRVEVLEPVTIAADNWWANAMRARAFGITDLSVSRLTTVCCSANI